MQAARGFDPLELFLDLGDALADEPAVGFDLRFAGPAEEAKTAALALKMGPASNEPASLIGEMGEFHLQAPFAGLCTLTENLEDQRRAVEHFGVPGLFEVALLHRRKLRIDDDHLRFERGNLGLDLVDLAGADQRRGPRTGERDDPLGDDVDP